MEIAPGMRSDARSRVWAQIEAAWLAGEYTTAKAILEEHPASAERDLLLAQLYLRLGLYEEVLRITAGSTGNTSVRDGDRARAAAFSAVALAALNRPEQALAAIAASRAGAADRAVAAELRFNEALVTWMLGDVQRSSELISHDVEGGCPDMDASLAARFFMLRGWQFAARERYRDQARALLDAIHRLESAQPQNVGLLAWCVFPLGALVRDLPIRAALDAVQRLESSLNWCADLHMAHVQTVRAVAWALTLQGEYIRAFRMFESAGLLARTPIAKMLVHTDHAHCARFSEQDVVADAQIAEVEELVRAHDWSQSTWEEARALIGAAELLAPRDTHRARNILELAQTLRPSMARNAGYAHDRRLSAHADYADALIRQATGDRRTAARRAKRAFDVFHVIGFDWQAARCALLLHKLGQGDEWLTQAQQSIETYPRSYVAQEIEKYRQRDPLRALTARQREVVGLLRRGNTIGEIAGALNLSPNTVRVHITRIHNAFGVDRRSQLLAALAREGL